AIAEQNKRIRLLKAEVAHLEQPERLQRLAKDLLGMAPLAATREGDLSSLDALVAGYTPAPPVATPAAPEAPAEEDIGPAAAPAEALAATAVVSPAPSSPAETGQ
ncbi:MAG TPA: hypothetical protein VEA44_07100, partial [Caulobacter sp.]|nr:hypothetical protein [Caulobacter sp.]